ncbi:conserved hypothetical protein, secreted [Candidatus Magnetomorum sp. HK-1]|nr:conserved hypothetical protein, secreted [Candidatus Magnetomorum sp. HK-1]
MLQKILILIPITLSFFSLLVLSAFSDEIRLHVPILKDSPQLHLYFHELLEKAIKETGHTPKLIPYILPQLRIKDYLDNGKISIYWLVETAERNKKYIPVGGGITNRLIGKRILFIKKGDQHLYDNVKTLDDFRKLNLVGGMGKKWIDAKVWKANNLKYIEHNGIWRSIFLMIPAGRVYNYFSRGINEIIDESKQYPDLDIEKRLIFIYDRDFRFYLSKTGENAGQKYKKVLKLALKNAKKNGIIEDLIIKYWGNDFKTLNYDTRIKIPLITPK